MRHLYAHIFVLILPLFPPSLFAAAAENSPTARHSSSWLIPADLESKIPRPEAETVGGLVGKLGSDDFNEREQAQRDLLRVGPGILFSPPFLQSLKSDDPDLRKRAQQIHDRMVAASRRLSESEFLECLVEALKVEAKKLEPIVERLTPTIDFKARWEPLSEIRAQLLNREALRTETETNRMVGNYRGYAKPLREEFTQRWTTSGLKILGKSTGRATGTDPLHAIQEEISFEMETPDRHTIKATLDLGRWSGPMQVRSEESLKLDPAKLPCVSRKPVPMEFALPSRLKIEVLRETRFKVALRVTPGNTPAEPEVVLVSPDEGTGGLPITPLLEKILFEKPTRNDAKSSEGKGKGLKAMPNQPRTLPPPSLLPLKGDKPN